MSIKEEKRLDIKELKDSKCTDKDIIFFIKTCNLFYGQK